MSRLNWCFAERRSNDFDEVFLDTWASLHGDLVLKGVIGGVDTSFNGKHLNNIMVYVGYLAFPLPFIYTTMKNIENNIMSKVFVALIGSFTHLTSRAISIDGSIISSY